MSSWILAWNSDCCASATAPNARTIPLIPATSFLFKSSPLVEGSQRICIGVAHDVDAVGVPGDEHAHATVVPDLQHRVVDRLDVIDASRRSHRIELEDLAHSVETELRFVAGSVDHETDVVLLVGEVPELELELG